MYQFKLSPAKPFHVICPHCRGRVIAVCEFYSAVRNIQSGLYAKRQIEQVYCNLSPFDPACFVQVWWEFVQNRARMLYARSGAGSISLVASATGLGGPSPVFRHERKLSLPTLSPLVSGLDPSGSPTELKYKENGMPMTASPQPRADLPHLPMEDEDDAEGGDLGGGILMASHGSLEPVQLDLVHGTLDPVQVDLGHDPLELSPQDIGGGVQIAVHGSDSDSVEDVVGMEMVQLEEPSRGNSSSLSSMPVENPW